MAKMSSTVQHCLKIVPKVILNRVKDDFSGFFNEKIHIRSFVVTQDYSKVEYAE